MYTHKIGLALGKGMHKTTEAEVAFNPSPAKFESYLESMKSVGPQHYRTLDVSYSILNAKENLSYRVTLTSAAAIDAVIADLAKVGTGKGKAKVDPLTIFKGLLETGDLTKKRRDKRRTKELEEEALTLKISEETGVDDAERTMLMGLTKSKAKAISFRVKDRHTRTVLSEREGGGFTLKVDATKVHMYFLDKDTEVLLERELQEVEIELMSAADVAKVPKPVIEAFSRTIQEVKDALDTKAPKGSPKASSSPAHSQSDSHSHSHSHSLHLSPKVVDGAVQPQAWTLPNRKGFLNWMYKTYKYPNSKEKEKDTAPGAISLFPHQKLVRDFMYIESPYRGIVLFHGLGVGKSLASIAAAEGFVKNRKKVIVMIPASLENNYREEIMKSATFGNPSQKLWTLIKVSPEQKVVLFEYLHIHPDFLKKASNTNMNLWLPTTLLEALPSGTGVGSGITVVPSKENLSWKSMSEAEHVSARETLSHLLDMKYTFVRYNGLSAGQFAKLPKDFFNDAFIVIDEAHNFVSRVVNGGNTSITRRIYNAIMESTGTKVVLLTGSPVINHPFELSVLLNLARGPMKIYSIPATAEGMDVLADSPYVDQYMTVESEKGEKGEKGGKGEKEKKDTKGTIEFSMLPHGFVNVMDNDGSKLVRRKKWSKSEADIVKDILTEAKIKLKGKGKGKEKVPSRDTYAFPGKKEDFVKQFIDQTDRENPKVINMEMFTRRALGLVSYFRSAGQELFPTVMPRQIVETPLCDTQFNTYVQARDKERSMEKKKKQGRRGLLDAESSVYRAYSRMACNFVFPKEVERVFPADVRQVMKREIQVVDEDEEKQAAAAGADAEEKDKGKPKTVKEADVSKKYDDTINKAMAALKTNADAYLSIPGLKNKYSSKFAKIYEDIESCPGKALIYSQFRVVEGLGIMSLMFQHHGYAEVKVTKRSDGSWGIHNAEEVLLPKYDGKRYIVFDEDREKANLLIKIFNGAFSELPAGIQEQMNANHKDMVHNLRGEFIRSLFITQSASEGISLRNVRRVLITEPFWNMVRLDQVIGRAVRTGSHLDLRPDERTVEVFIYTSTFTQKQLNDNFTLRRQDNSVTSDTHIMQKAMKKEALIKNFTDAMKSGAVDCRNNASENKAREQGLSCYAFPVNVDKNSYAFTGDFEYDKEHLLQKENRFVQRRRIQGNVVSTTNAKGEKTKYVQLDDKPGKLYDYVAYKDAGVLIEK